MELLVELLVLLLLANGMPVLGARVLGARGAWPLDGGRVLADGRRVLGETKTWRGVLLAVVTVTPAAVLFGYAWWVGVLFALASMAGDAASSFCKRRLGIESSGRASGLDQIPEALLPLLVCYRLLDLTPLLVVAVVVLFTVGQMVISPLMFRLGIRHRPH